MNTKSKGVIWTFVAIILFVGLIVWGKNASHKAVKTVENPTILAGLQNGNAPWPAEIVHLFERLHQIGLPALSTEGTVLHIHQHLDIFIHGHQVLVPAGIGINTDAQFISPLHVHDDTNVIHVESPTMQTFTLGQFFDVWGVQLTNDCIGGYCTTDGQTFKVFSNGMPYTGNPRDLALNAHQEIVIAYGTPAELPATIPSTYAFPDGE